MNSRFTLAFLAALGLTAGVALAGPLGGIGVGAGGRGSIGVGVPPLAVPPAGIPRVQPPPHVPPANANVNARTNANAAGAVSRDVLHGTLDAVGATTATLTLSNGSSQTYTVSPQTASRLQSDLHRTIAYRMQNGVLTSVGAGTPPLQGTLLGVNGTTAQIKLANGTTQTYMVNAQQAAWLQAHAGKHIAFWTSANGAIELNQSSHRSGTSHGRSPKKPGKPVH